MGFHTGCTSDISVVGKNYHLIAIIYFSGVGGNHYRTAYVTYVWIIHT